MGGRNGDGVEQLLTTAEVAAKLRVPVSTVARWRWDASGPVGFRVGKGIRYPVSAVNAWLNEKAERERDRAKVKTGA